MFFRAAKKYGHVASKPFAEVTAKAAIRQERFYFVTREETAKLLAVCHTNWKAIIGLSRYSGLRCPSEVLSLRWEDVTWETNRITAPSPKTERRPGKAYPVIPMFPELRPILEEAFETTPERAVYVVGRNHREASNVPAGWRNCNLRTQLDRLLKRAGLKPWPRRFHAMRSSREPELAKRFDIKTATEWIGTRRGSL